MSLRPTTRIRLGLRVALRRRYGYAAMRVLHRALRRALQDHRARRVAPVAVGFDSGAEMRELRALYRRALRRLLRRWPNLNTFDQRSQP